MSATRRSPPDYGSHGKEFSGEVNWVRSIQRETITIT
jgi:hypothetical protein